MRSQLQLRFFGLNSEYRKAIFKQIHEIVFHGNGGYDWTTVYNMPIWLRNVTFDFIKESIKQQNPENKNDENIDITKINKNNIPQHLLEHKSDYTTKASK